MEKKNGRTEIAELGEFGLIDRLMADVEPKNETTLLGCGDDAAAVAAGEREAVVCTTDLLTEGVDFDLTYFPLRHLGYKVDFVGGDTRASLTGLTLHVTVLGRVERDRMVRRDGARINDLICITGNLGAAYMGLRLLEREKRVLSDVKNPEPQFGGYEYLLERYLKPRARKDIVDALREEGIVPTSMIDLSDGLASDLMQICKASKCGARIYLERIPIAKQTTAFAEEIHADPVVAALNGGEDHELLFTVPLSMQEKIMQLGMVDVIGHITAENTGAYLVTPDGSDIRLKAQGFPEKE